MASIIEVLREQARQQATGDDTFYKSMTYMFKLVTAKGKGPTGPTGEAWFPLPINPESFKYSLPFASEITTTQHGGAIVDEGGIVVGRINMSGTTGFKLRKVKDTSLAGGSQRFTGLIPKGRIMPGQKLSGHAQIWRLLGRCFDAYSELKKDPVTSHLTHMEFHSYKHQLHLEVIPREPDVGWDKDKNRVIAHYNLNFDVLGPVRITPPGTDPFASDDRGIFDYVSDSSSFIRSNLNMLKATIDDFTACQEDFKRRVTNFSGILDDLTAVHDAVSDFVSGVTSYVNIPNQFLTSLTGTVESASTVAATYTDIPRKARQAFSEAADTLDALKAGCRGHYRDQLDKRVENINAKMDRFSNLTDQQQANIDSAATTGSSADQSVSKTYGATYQPGDKVRQTGAKAILDLQPGEFQGFEEVQIQHGDTIFSLAVKHMGDPSKWKAIAVINNLRSPYISDGVRIGGTLKVGDPIVVPISDSSAPLSALTSGDPGVGKSKAEAFHGTDFKWVRLANGKWSWAIDTAHGSSDVLTVSGIKNTEQGLATRMRTEQGTDPSFPNVGLQRQIGSRGTIQAHIDARQAVENQILADRRIQRILGLSFTEEGDAVTIVADAQPVGYDTSRNIPVTLY